MVTRKQNKMAGISQNRNEMAKIWHIYFYYKIISD